MKIIITENQLKTLLTEKESIIYLPSIRHVYSTVHELEPEYFNKILELVKQGQTPYNAFRSAGFDVESGGWIEYTMSPKQYNELVINRKKYLDSQREPKVKPPVDDFLNKSSKFLSPDEKVIKIKKSNKKISLGINPVRPNLGNRNNYGDRYKSGSDPY